MTTLDLRRSRARSRARCATGRRDRRHGARSSRQRRAVDAARGRARRDHQDGAHGSRRRARSTGTISSSSSALARSCSRSARRRTRSARSTDVARAAALAHARGARVFVDAVAYAPHALVDVRAIDCDFLACSAYKFYGPHLGILYGRHELLAALDVAKLAPAPSQAPDRWETGTLNFEALAGTTAAIDFLASTRRRCAGMGTRRHASRETRARVPRAARAQRAALRIAVERPRRDPGRAALRPPPSSAPRAPTVAFTSRASTRPT